MLFEETLLSLTEATNELARVRGKKPHVSTLWRWAKKGIRGVKLEVICIGGQLITSKEALSRFCKQLSKAQTSKILNGSKKMKSHESMERIETSRKRIKKQGITYKVKGGQK